MVAPTHVKQLKPSARRALAKTDALYLFDDGAGQAATRDSFNSWREISAAGILTRGIPVYTRAELPELVAAVRAIHARVAA
jgi:hypothetical protein